MNWHSRITRHFPRATPIHELRERLQKWLHVEHGARRETTLLATSACADDIIASKDLSRDVWGPFTAGGLGGLPFGGLTALSAYAHHVPEQGTALIVYGPHIGITSDGALGKLLRPGQSSPTAACGSLMAALDRLREGEPSQEPLHVHDDDLQQSRLVQLLAAFRPRILRAALPEKEITEVAYELSHAMVHRLLSSIRADFQGAQVAFVGGVVINTNPDEDDWFEVRHQGCFAT